MAPLKPASFTQAVAALSVTALSLRTLATNLSFPLAALPPVLSSFTTALAGRTQTPPVLVAQSVLSVAALLAQRHLDLRLPTGDVRPVSALFLTVAEAGENAGAVKALTLAPLRNLEAHMVVDPLYEQVRALWAKEGRHIPRLAPNILREDDAARDSAWSSCTPPGLFVAEDCVALVGRGPDRKRADALGLCALWDGARRTARLSAHVVATPRDARAFLSDPALGAYGLFGRLLAVYPKSSLGARVWSTPEAGQGASDESARLAYTAMVIDRLTREQPKTRRVLPFSAAAAHAWVAFAREIETEMGEGARFSGLRAFASLLPEHAARLAASLAFFADAEVAELGDAHIAAGIALARYYAGEALRLADHAAATPELEEADLLLAWLQRTRAGQTIGLRDIYRDGPGFIREAHTARRLMLELQRHGAVRPKRSGANGPQEWELVGHTPQAAATLSHDVA